MIKLVIMLVYIRHVVINDFYALLPLILTIFWFQLNWFHNYINKLPIQLVNG